jgi:hypothetical protein
MYIELFLWQTLKCKQLARAAEFNLLVKDTYTFLFSSKSAKRCHCESLLKINSGPIVAIAIGGLD